MSNSWYYWHDNKLFLHIYLQPRATSDSIVGIHDKCLKLRLKAPAIDGRANQYLVKFLANCFKVKDVNVSLVKGNKSRKKLLCITDPVDTSILNENYSSQ